MRIVVLGPGALGCLLAAFLAEAGEEVLLMDHRPERAKIIASQGLMVEDRSGQRVVRPLVSRFPKEAAGADLVLVCVKAYHTAEAITPYLPHLGPRTRIMTFQNGVGNVEILSELCGAERVWGGITAQGATVLGPGHIRHGGRGDTLFGAVLPEGQEERLAAVAELFTKAGLPATVKDEVQSIIWSKLIINVGINPLTALTRLRNGQLLDLPDTGEIMDRAVAEAVSVAEAQGIRLVYPDPIARTREVARATAENIASMLQDVRAQRQTEIDQINGAVSFLGRKLGIPTPVNDTLTGLVRTIQAAYGSTV